MSEQRAPYNAGEQPPEWKTTVVQEITFTDGSRLRIEVDARADADGGLASLAYFDHVLPALFGIDSATTIDPREQQ